MKYFLLKLVFEKPTAVMMYQQRRPELDHQHKISKRLLSNTSYLFLL